MRHIKLFENFEEKLYVSITPNQAYEMITTNDIVDHCEPDNIEPFDSRDISEIKSVIPMVDDFIDQSPYGKCSFRYNGIDVIKCKDEYFLGLYWEGWEEGYSDDRGTIPTEYWPMEHLSDSAECFKCDQIDGLIKFLEDYS